MNQAVVRRHLLLNTAPCRKDDATALAVSECRPEKEVDHLKLQHSLSFSTIAFIILFHIV
jgi:hypothetical protein